MKLHKSLAVAAALLAAAGATPARADVAAGRALWNRADYSGAVAAWRPLAIGGDVDAQMALAEAYKLGRGVPLDLRMAELWYGKAAAQGNIEAKDQYALTRFRVGDRAGAMPLIEEAAGRGEPRAQYILATALFNGDLVKQDWVRAYALMTRSAAAGLTIATTSLAQMDKTIPLSQRQRGIELARTFETAEARPQLAQIGAPPVIGTEALPPSSVATPAQFPAQAPVRQVRSKPVPTPVVKKAVEPEPKPAPVVAAKPKPPAVPAEKPAPAPSGDWKVQLAAFGDAAKAGPLWASLHKRIAALGPYRSFVVKAGPVVRLQAGPLASRAEAAKLCATLKTNGQPCLPVAP